MNTYTKKLSAKKEVDQTYEEKTCAATASLSYFYDSTMTCRFEYAQTR